MNFLHEFNIPNCGLHTCTKCTTTPSWVKQSQYELLTQYLLEPVSTPVENLDSRKALEKIKWILEDIMETMNCVQTVYVHDDGSETVVEGPNLAGTLYHLFNGIKNTLTLSGINIWEYNDTLFLQDAQIDDSSIWAEDALDYFLAQDKPDEEE